VCVESESIQRTTHKLTHCHNGHFFAFAKRIHSVFHNPERWFDLSGLFAMLLVLTGTYQELHYSKSSQFSSFCVDRCRAHSAAHQDLSRPFRVWGYLWTPLIFGAAACALIAVNLWLIRGVRSSIGLAAIMLGLPFFYHWRKRAIA